MAKFHIDSKRWHPEDCQHREIVLSESALSRVIKRRNDMDRLQEILPSTRMTTALASARGVVSESRAVAACAPGRRVFVYI